MKIRTPQEIGMPEHIERWRPNQEAMIDTYLNDRQRVTISCAPTGSGKTDAYMAGVIESGKPTAIVTNSKGLQDQIMRDYEALGAVDLRGRANYPCDMKAGYTCDNGYAANCPYKKTPACASHMAELKASLSYIVVTNYDKWTASKKFGPGLDHIQQVVFDEAHHAPEALAKSMQVVLHHKEIEDTLGLDFPDQRFRDEIDGWKVWAKEAKEIAQTLHFETLAKIKGSSNPKPGWFRLADHMKKLAQRLTTVIFASPKNWVVEEIDGGYQFDPIRPGQYAESMLLFRVPRIIMVSATIRPKTVYMTGISRLVSEFHEYDSSFDRSRSPVYWVPTMRVDYRSKDMMAQVWNRLDQFAYRRQDRKGIVHTISFARQEEIMKHSSLSRNMIFNPRGDAPAETIKKFKNANDGAILVSPSVGTGYDFPGTECEWQFIAKIPFIDGRSKVIQARQELDGEYKAYIAYQNLVQMIGRGTRSETDQCENIIPDDNCEWFIPKYAHLAPQSFYGSHRNNIAGFYQVVDRLPPPPKRLAR